MHSASTKRAGLVTLTDLAPTILDVLGAEVPDEMIGQPLRYRSAVPLMFVVMILTFLGAQAVSIYAPLVRTGAAPGVIINRVMVGLMVVGLVLSLIQRRKT